MLVVGLHGWILPPSAILLCDVFVYSEFMIHPLLLLAFSTKMRTEIGESVKSSILVSGLLKELTYIYMIFQALMHGFHIQLNCCSFNSPKSSVWICNFKHNKVTDITSTRAQFDELSVDKLKIDPTPFHTYQKTKQVYKPHLYYTNCQNILEGINNRHKTNTHCNSPLTRFSDPKVECTTSKQCQEHKETQTRHSIIKQCIEYDKKGNGLKSETQNETDIENIIGNGDLNLNKSELNSETPCSFSFISGVKFDESIATIHNHNVSKKYKAKLMQEKEETHLEINRTGMFLNETNNCINQYVNVISIITLDKNIMIQV